MAISDAVASVTGLTATADIRSVTLGWSEVDPFANGGGPSYKRIDAVEVWASQTNDRDGTATKVAEGRKTAVHATSGERQTWYYWIKPRIADATYGAWYPSGNTAGITTKTKGASDTAYALVNGTIVTSISGGALTVAIKTLAGVDPSADDPVSVVFWAAGASEIIKITAALSFTITAGSTLGVVANDPFRIHWGLLNDGGTLHIGGLNASFANGVITGLGDSLASGGLFSTAEGGAGAADSRGAIYADVTLSSKPFRVIGDSVWNSGLATPGTWVAPTETNVFRIGASLPGDEQSAISFVSFGAGNATATIPDDNTIPQISEGNVAFSATAVASPADLFHLRMVGSFSTSNNNKIVVAAFWGSGTDAQAASVHETVADKMIEIVFECVGRVNATGTISIYILVGCASAGTIRVNSDSGGGKLGGKLASFFYLSTIRG